MVFIVHFLDYFSAVSFLAEGKFTIIKQLQTCVSNADFNSSISLFLYIFLQMHQLCLNPVLPRL